MVENLVYRESIRGSDVEIMAASALLDNDIYVTNNDYRKPGSITREVRWNLLRATTNPTATFHITNYGLQYEPVVSMLNSPYPTYATTDDIQPIE